MTSTTKQMVKGGKRVARKTLDKVETEVMAAVGRRAVRSKVGAAKKVAGEVGRAAVKAGLIAGAGAAAGMIVSRISRKRKDG
ncbi:MAG: hypothetical protein IT358_09980 [Gemmatimonadaceae bacterium]|jgi:hypothetical protein|nr:hypothetical protein [Gemmatimonadota bacterium]MCC7324147.1 hypothetical protein [Gemmatimonadaceae bacterium]